MNSYGLVIKFFILFETFPFFFAVGDSAFKCPIIHLAQLYARSPTSSVYLYEFNHRPSISDWPDWSGSLHGDEIQFVFGLPLRAGSNYTTDEQKLSQEMMQYWTNFAKTG